MQDREPSYRFDDFEVAPKLFRLQRAGSPIEIEPRSFEVLVYLIEHRDGVVTKDELFGALWQQCHVTDNALSRAVARLRHALADDARQPRYIATVHGRGYRFCAVLEGDRQPTAGRRSPLRDASAAVTLAAGVGGLLWLMSAARRRRGVTSGFSGAFSTPNHRPTPSPAA